MGWVSVACQSCGQLLKFEFQFRVVGACDKEWRYHANCCGQEFICGVPSPGGGKN